MTAKKNICVYCASSKGIRKEYFEAAEKFAELMVANGFGCICGAGKEGLMGCVADAVMANGGEVTGIIPKFMVDNGWKHESLTETIVTADIHERKRLMAEMSDCAVALPGGCGTFEELLEIITWKQLGLYSKPVIILNTLGYYDSLIAMLDKAIDEHFMKGSHAGLWHVAATPEKAIEEILSLPSDEPVAETKY